MNDNRPIGIFDSGAAIARQAKRVLKNNKALSSASRAEYTFFTTANSSKFKETAEKLLLVKLASVRNARI